MNRRTWTGLFTAGALLVQVLGVAWASPVAAPADEITAAEAMPCHPDAAPQPDAPPAGGHPCCDGDSACHCVTACASATALPVAAVPTSCPRHRPGVVAPAPAATLSAHLLTPLRPPIAS